MSEFDDKLSAILGDQNAMSQIMALAQSLGGSKPADRECGGEPDSGGEPACTEGTEGVPVQLCAPGRDVQLLTALRPYLRAERQRTLDRALDLVQMLRLLKSNR